MGLVMKGLVVANGMPLVGYKNSEVSFSRAFKRPIGRAAQQHRAGREAGGSAAWRPPKKATAPPRPEVEMARRPAL
jgi:hypothetical protein